MAKSKLYYAQICVGIIICFTGLTYWLFWHSGITGQLHIRLAKNNTHMPNCSCLEQLMTDFGVNEFQPSLPTYVRLSKPVPISKACRDLLANFTSTPRLSRESNFSNYQKQLDNETDREKMHWYVHQLFTNFSRRNLELFLAGGSLLGSVRHFGFFTWDADADVMIRRGQKPHVKQLLIDMSASDEYRFVDAEGSTGHWQFGLFCSPIAGKPRRQMYGTKRLYPEKYCKTIVDFFFGWPEGKKFYKRRDGPGSFPISDVYPLTLRPFGPYLLPVPRNSANFLAAVYGSDYESKCVFKYFHYRYYRCDTLRSLYPFVAHLRLPCSGRIVNVDLLVQDSSMLSLFIPPEV